MLLFLFWQLNSTTRQPAAPTISQEERRINENTSKNNLKGVERCELYGPLRADGRAAAALPKAGITVVEVRNLWDWIRDARSRTSREDLRVNRLS
jgi:hypothetical protein